MWLWGAGLGGEVAGRWAQTGGPMPGSVWRGLVRAVTWEFQSPTCQTVIGLEISWTPSYLIYLGLASVSTSPRGVSQHFFFFFAKGNRKMRVPSSSSPHTLFSSPSRIPPGLLRLCSAFHKWHHHGEPDHLWFSRPWNKLDLISIDHLNKKICNKRDSFIFPRKNFLYFPISSFYCQLFSKL